MEDPVLEILSRLELGAEDKTVNVGLRDEVDVRGKESFARAMFRSYD